MYIPTVRNSGAWDGTVRSEWNFDTIKSTSAMGSYRSMIRDFGTHGTIPDEDELVYAYDEERSSTYEPRESVQTDGATKGSDGPSHNSLMSNAEASRSTVVIRPIPTPPNEKDLPSLLQDTGSDEAAGALEPSTPPHSSDNVEPPPAYSGSVRSQRRASYAARNNVTSGTVLVEADLGNGIDTIRPVKKVDTVRSLRLSEEYVGSLKRDRSGSGSTSGSAPSSPVNSKMGSGRKVSEASKAGVAMVNEVLLPTLDRVCRLPNAKEQQAHRHSLQRTRDDMDAREIESLSMIARGFEELRDVNPELAYNVILDVLSGINEYVLNSVPRHSR